MFKCLCGDTLKSRTSLQEHEAWHALEAANNFKQQPQCTISEYKFEISEVSESKDKPGPSLSLNLLHHFQSHFKLPKHTFGALITTVSLMLQSYDITYPLSYYEFAKAFE